MPRQTISVAGGDKPKGSLRAEDEICMFEKHYFIARACSESSQAGKIQAHGLIPNEIRFTAPEEFGGEPSAWTPEHFLLSAISSCFIATFQAISKASNFQFAGLEVVAEGVVEKVDNRLRFASVTVNPLVIVDSEEDRERALAVGFKGYITKPIAPETFVGEVAALMSSEQRQNPIDVRTPENSIEPVHDLAGALTTFRGTILVVDNLQSNLDLARCRFSSPRDFVCCSRKTSIRL